MPVTVKSSVAARVAAIPPTRLRPSRFSEAIYGDSVALTDDLLPSVREHGILVSLVVATGPEPGTWEVISGHRRLACALALGLTRIPCEIRSFPNDAARRLAILEYNRQRQKSFSQGMREADALAELWKTQAKSRRLANLRKGGFERQSVSESADGRNSDSRWVLRMKTDFDDEKMPRSARRSGSNGYEDCSAAWARRKGSLPSSTCDLAASSIRRRSGPEWCCST